MDAQKISAMAEQLNIKIPSMSTELSNSIEELKKLPTLLQVGAALCCAVLTRLPP